MTSITFGGGPTLEARRAFSNLKPGSQVPGYLGYIHQLKFNNGHTYGDQTHLLATQRSKTSIDGFKKTPVPVSSDEPVPFRSIQASLSNELPKPNGVNKLTESMVPGYTGYVPNRKFRFSNTYRNECDQSIDAFLTERKTNDDKRNSLISTVQSQRTHVPISTGADLREKLDTVDYVKHISDKRGFTEAPIPGYTGYIPKLRPTDIGLGHRYHNGTERSLESFKSDYLKYRSASSVPNLRSLQFDPASGDSLGGSGSGAYTTRQEGTVAGPLTQSRRTFVKPGMIPKYTGHVHGIKYDIGKTYGNSTRDLPVCYHNYPNFGVYLDKNPNKTIIC